jgi:hypothetical protein
VTERLDELVKLISELMIDNAMRKDSESFLQIAMATHQLFRAVPGAEKQSRSALYSIENALALLLDKLPAPDVSDIKMVCSFCDRGKPEVMLGAGANAFICDECVDLFTVMFRERRAEREIKELGG